MNKKYEKIQLENDFNENEENSDDNSEISSQNNNNPEIEIKELKILIKNSQKLYKKITEFNYIATEKIKSSKYKEALIFLQQSEKILEFAASCGKELDRNLIVVILYNSACAYQGLWQLEKCSKYLDGVIYNMETCLKENKELESNNKKYKNERESDIKSDKIKKLKFLILCNLQFSAILSQLGFHEKSLENAKKTWTFLSELFSECFILVKELKKHNEFLCQYKNSNTKNSIVQSQEKKKIYLNESSESSSCIKTPSSTGMVSKSSTKNEIPFSKIVLDYAFPILEYINTLKTLDEISNNGKEMLIEVKRSLYFWKNNPENNERYLRKELKLMVEKDEEKRSLLGVADSTEWLESFNIGSIMHMNPIIYEEFLFSGEFIYEISKKMLLEKVIYLSIGLFTMATEIRFIEIDKAKNDDKNKKERNDFKLSEVYHLKAIEIVCKCISCNCPYINHLITSYHKHYNQNLEIIPEESFCSTTDRRISPNKNNDAYGQKNNEKKLNLDFNFISTSSPKIKKLLSDLKKQKNKPKEKLFEDQKLFLQTLNENLKKNLNDKKTINIGNSYKFIVSLPKNEKKIQKVEQIKKNYNENKNKKDETKIQFLNKQETFKPLSARTHNEIVKSTQKIEKLLSESKQIPKNNSSPINTNIQKQKYILPKPNLLKKKELIPRLNLSSLKNHNEEVKFFTPREKNINLNY